MVDFSGKWRVNLAQSRFMGPQPEDILVTIEHAEPRLAQRIVVKTAAGEELLDFVFLIGGDEALNMTRGAEWRTRAHWDQDELIIESQVKTPARDFRFRDCWSLSKDGRGFVMEHRDDDLAGQRAVLDRV